MTRRQPGRSSFGGCPHPGKGLSSLPAAGWTLAANATVAKLETEHIEGISRARRHRGPRTLVADIRGAGRALRRMPRSRGVILAVGGAIAGLGLGAMGRGVGPQVTSIGPAPNAQLGPASIDRLKIQIKSTNARLLTNATLTLDGGDITDDARTPKGGFFYQPRDLSEGAHRVELTVDQPLLPWPDRRTWTFTIDKTPPKIAILSGQDRNERWKPVTITGTVDEASRVFVDGRAVALRNGIFTKTLPTPPVQPVEVRAIDQAGNSALAPVDIKVIPRATTRPVRAVHVTAIAWKSATIRAAIYRQFERRMLTAVELDLKDERGIVGYNSQSSLGKRIGAVRPEYDLADAVREVHSRGGRVIGRLVAFRDPELASWAWANGRKDMVVQNPAGYPYSSSGGFTNLASDDVRSYNLSIAVEAARAGVDEILYDYVRRPDGPIESMRFPGLPDSPSDEIVRFLQQTQLALKPTNALLGASIFGIAAGRRGPDEIAQDVPRMSRYLDVVAPMLYPAGWAKGEYEVADPERQPGQIVERVLRKFQEETAGTGARVVPWLQDYTIAVQYTGAQVREQVAAAERVGVGEFMLWNPYVEYHFDGLDPLPTAAPVAAGSEAAPGDGSPSGADAVTGEVPTTTESDLVVSTP